MKSNILANLKKATVKQQEKKTMGVCPMIVFILCFMMIDDVNLLAQSKQKEIVILHKIALIVYRYTDVKE